MGKFVPALRWTCVLILVVFFNSLNAGELDNPAKIETINKLKSDFPGIKIFETDNGISRLYGQPVGRGVTAEASANGFISNYSLLFGVEFQDLLPQSLLSDQRHVQPVMYDQATGRYKFTLVYYSQYKDNIPVYKADLRLLTRNESDFPLVLACSALRDLDDFEVPINVSLDQKMAENSVKLYSDNFINFDIPRLVVWAGLDEMEVDPAVAIEITADNGLYATGDYEKRLFLLDAQSGEILYSENLIIDIDVSGNVSGMATSGNGADICGPELQTPLQYARVFIGSNLAFADDLGNFTILNSGSAPVTVTSNIRGDWFRVFNQNGADAQLTSTVTPPGPANFIHNQSNTSEYNRAEVNAYIHSNIVRDFTLNYNPVYPQLHQTEFPVNVNLNDNCNAYYDYSSINFFTSGGGCPNTAFSTIVHHEYGHHLVSVGGSGQGMYGEGMGDVMGILITDNPGLAYGFYGNCNSYMRTGDNTMQYPCSGEIHYCGQLISGCVWSIRNELIVNYPINYIDIVANMAVNAILLHSGTDINPSIVIDYLTLDDDDGYIGNGTPHFQEICDGFSDHNMDCPELDLISFSYPNGKPSFVSPSGNSVMNVEVVGVVGTPQPNTGYFHYDIGNGFVSVQMTMVSPNVYEAEFPSADCGTAISFYVSAQTDGGMTIYDPYNAPASTHGTMAAYDLVVAYDDNFETNQGWTVQNAGGLTDGAWERGIPAGGGDRGDPAIDYDGSGRCYVTDNADDNSDVDDGYTYLISPAFDLSAGDGIIEYALWYTNNNGADPNNDLFKVWVSSNNGTNWTLVETIGPVSSSGWTEHSFVVGNYVTPTGQVKIRFEASDLNLGSIVEAGIDAVSVVIPDCNAPGCVYIIGDVNGSGDYNGLDVTYGVSFFKGGSDPLCPVCALCPDWWYCGDVNSSCSYNGLDITYGVSYLKGGAAPEPCADCPPFLFNSAYPNNKVGVKSNTAVKASSDKK